MSTPHEPSRDAKRPRLQTEIVPTVQRNRFFELTACVMHVNLAQSLVELREA